MIKCGLCGKIKTKQNHWWTLAWNLTLRSTFTFPMEAELTQYIPTRVTVVTNETHYCGIECLSKAESMVRSGENPVREIPE